MKILPRRRRLEAKTDYKTRLSLLDSNKPRLILRKTNRYIIAQVAISENAQDKVIASVNSKDLSAIGWYEENSGKLKSRAAAYLTGYMLGKKLNGRISEAILDIGMHRNIHKSRLYAALRGALDSGLKVPHGSNALPPMEMIEGDKDVKAIFNKIKEKLK